MIRNVILIGVMMVVPAFFIGLFLMSGYHSLKKLRDRCAKTLSAAQYEQAARDYDAERRRFPSLLAAFLFRFPPAPPFKGLSESGQGPGSRA